MSNTCNSYSFSLVFILAMMMTLLLSFHSRQGPGVGGPNKGHFIRVLLFLTIKKIVQNFKSPAFGRFLLFVIAFPSVLASKCIMFHGILVYIQQNYMQDKVQ